MFVCCSLFCLVVVETTSKRTHASSEWRTRRKHLPSRFALHADATQLCSGRAITPNAASAGQQNGRKDSRQRRLQCSVIFNITGSFCPSRDLCLEFLQAVLCVRTHRAHSARNTGADQNWLTAVLATYIESALAYSSVIA